MDAQPSVVSPGADSVEIPQTEVTQEETGKPETSSTRQKEDGSSGKESSEQQKQSLDEKKEKERQRLKFKSKIDGEEIEEEVDYDEVARDRQKWKAADKRFQEAANLKKEAFEVIKLGQSKDGLIELIRKFGYDPRELAEEFLANQLQFEMMTPEQKENYELRRQLYERDQLAKKDLTEKEQRAETEATERIKTQMQQEIIDTLKTSGLPASTDTVKRMAAHMARYLERGIDVSAKDVVKDVWDEINVYSKAVLKNLPIQKLLEVIGEEKAKEWRAYDLGKVKDPLSRGNQQSGQAFPEIKKTPKGFVSDKDFEAHLRRVKAG